MKQKNSGKNQKLTEINSRCPVQKKQLQKLETQFNLKLKFAENADEKMEDSLWFSLFDLLGLLDKPTNENHQGKESKNPNYL